MSSSPLTNNSNHKLKFNKELTNPCLKEHDVSMRCLAENDKELCEVTFKNYTQCRAFWDKVRLERRKAGIKPQLPSLEERDAVKEFYMKKWGTFNKKSNATQED